MGIVAQENWQQANQTYLFTSLAGIKAHLKQDAQDADEPSLKPPTMPNEKPATLVTLCEWFQLSDFECALLLLCAGIELDTEFATLCENAHGTTYPTFSLALTHLPHAHWSALAPDSPLRYWQLIEIEHDRVLTHSPLRIDERILHYLLGITSLDKRLLDLFHPLSLTHTLPPSQLDLAHELANTLIVAAESETLPIIQLYGSEAMSQRDIAVVIASLLNQRIFKLSATALPTQPTELARFLHLWTRETMLDNVALLLDCHTLEHTDALRESALEQMVETSRGLLLIASPTRRTMTHFSHQLLSFEIDKPTPSEQKALWHTVLAEHMNVPETYIDRLVEHFHLDSSTIATISAVARTRLSTQDEGQILNAEVIGATLWECCRVQANPRLDDLALRIEASANWDDLVLPGEQRQILQDIVAQVQQRAHVYEHWGFRGQSQRGLGISALFAGASGVGKTMAAEVLANKLRLELYRIDLSAVASKYIGETEKNLRQIFDAAESSGVILLFDEADALFGKRSDVKDSHDRHANIEVSYLLQRMEAYRGLAILTTNMKDALDNAFLRRIRFVVQFPFPDVIQRVEIWRRVFPSTAPTADLDAQKLAQLHVTGGNIRNIALYAAFIAADRGESIRMSHILRAARHEYAKLEKPLTQIELRGWDETINY
jgi:ATP-dependent 26S proteasome regulatory subunit